jgi:hypothetical protein
LLREIDNVLAPTKETQEALDRVTARIVSMIKKTDLVAEELKYDKDFEKNCIILSSFINEPVEKISVRKYFTLIEHYNDLNKKHGRAKDKVRRTI